MKFIIMYSFLQSLFSEASIEGNGKTLDIWIICELKRVVKTQPVVNLEELSTPAESPPLLSLCGHSHCVGTVCTVSDVVNTCFIAASFTVFSCRVFGNTGFSLSHFVIV